MSACSDGAATATGGGSDPGAVVRVAAAVIERAGGDVLLAQRPTGKPYAGYWEFPGGKLEAAESPADALSRELNEELGIVVARAAPWLVQRFVYPHAHVELHFFRVREWRGDPVGHDGQALAWQNPHAIDVAPLLPANARVLAALRLPPVYAITCAGDSDEATFLRRAEAALERGLRLLQIREKTWETGRRDAFASRIRALANAVGARVLLNGEAEAARALGLAGVHWTADALAAATSRPRDMLVAASCHTREDLRRASGLDLDFAVLGPVRLTPTHPHATPLGWDGFARVAAGSGVPVFALGGLAHDDLEIAIAHGAHGIAMRRHAWPAA